MSRHPVPAAATALLLALVPTLSATAATDPPIDPPDARLRAAMAAAVDLGPAARRDDAALRARAAATRAEAGAGSFGLELQREGLDTSLDDEANAIAYLRLVAPFHGPGQRGPARRLAAGADDWLGDARAAARLERAGEAGVLWLQLAAEDERVELARRRLERMDHALTLQRKRLELGEVSGTEVTQLELARAADSARLRAALARRSELVEALRVLAGDGVPRPAPGDLEALVAATAGVREEAAAGAGPLARAALSAAELERRRSELVRATAWGVPELHLELEDVPDLGPADGFTAFGFLLSVPLPLGKAGRERRAAAELEAEAAAAAGEERRLALEGRLRTAEAAAFAAAAVLDELAPTLERLARTEHSLAEQYRLGAISYLVYIDGLGRLDDLVSQAIDSRRALLEARLAQAVVLDDDRLFPLPTTGGTP